MKTLTYMSLMMAFAFTFTLGFTSCSDDDDDKQPAPQITIEEANIEEDVLCTEADVVAQGRTVAILLTITDQQGNIKVSYPVTESKYIGVLNIEGFHVHVPIADKGVQEGDVLTMTVTDAQGLSASAQKSITEEEDED